MTCYLVEYTLHSFHVRFIYPFSFQSLIGVVGIDIALSELLQNTVVSKHYFPSEFYALHFNYSFTRVSALFIKLLLQSFGPGELSYTFVIETENGRALVHPQLPEPEEIQEEPVVIIISDLETSPGKRWFLAIFWSLCLVLTSVMRTLHRGEAEGKRDWSGQNAWRFP